MTGSRSSAPGLTLGDRRRCTEVLLLLVVLTTASGASITVAQTRDPTLQDPYMAASSVPSINMTMIGPGSESSVAVNPADPSNIIVTGSKVGSGLNSDYLQVASVSSDGGRSWRDEGASLSYVNSVIPNLWYFYDHVGTFDANGNAYVGTVDRYGSGTADGPFSNYLFKSEHGRNTFLLTQPFLKLTDYLLNYGNGTVVQPCASGPDMQRDYPAVIADSYNTSAYKNNVYVLVRMGAQVSPSLCSYGEAYERSTDGGETWGSGIWFGPPAFASDISLADNRGMTIAPDGTIFLAVANSGAPIVLKSTDGGVSFQEIPINVPPHFFVSWIEVASTNAATIYAVLYSQNVSGPPVDIWPYHLYSVVSHDGGSNWSPLVRVDDVTNPDSTHVVYQVNAMWDISLSQETGRVDVAWLDLRNNGGNLTLADIYYSYSYDGLSWATNIRATDGPYYYCTAGSSSCSRTGNDFMWVASSGPRAYIVASMGASPCGNSCTDARLYTRFVTVSLPSPPESFTLSWMGYDWDGGGEETLTLNGQFLASLPPTDSPQNAGAYAPFSLDITSFVVQGTNTLTFTHADWDCAISDNVRNLQVMNGTTAVYNNSTELPLSCTQSLSYSFTTITPSPSVGGSLVPINKLILALPYVILGLAVVAVTALTSVVRRQSRKLRGNMLNHAFWLQRS